MRPSGKAASESAPLSGRSACPSPDAASSSISLPADLPKSGTGFDLAVAMAILAATGDVPAEGLDGLTFAGELALDGEVRPVPGILSIAESSRSHGRLRLVVAPENAAEAAAVPGIEVLPAPHLGAVVAHVAGRELLVPWVAAPSEPEAVTDEPDLGEVRGQALPRRALEIAAAGGHNILLTGPPAGQDDAREATPRHPASSRKRRP